MPRRTSKRIVDFFKNNNDNGENSMGNNSTQNDQEVLSLLQKISQQLDNMGAKEDDGMQPNQQSGTQQASSAKQQAGAEIQALYKLLQQTINEQNQQQMSEQNDDSSGSEKENTSQPNSNQGIRQRNKGLRTTTTNTAQQILEQAQYELANELEASLKKLKEVITESENLAAKISALIGQDSNQK